MLNEEKEGKKGGINSYEAEENQPGLKTYDDIRPQTEEEIIESIINSVPPEERDALFVNE